MQSSGSNGTAYNNFTLYVGSKPFSILGLDTPATIGLIGGISIAVFAAVALTVMKKKN